MTRSVLFWILLFSHGICIAQKLIHAHPRTSAQYQRSPISTKGRFIIDPEDFYELRRVLDNKKIEYKIYRVDSRTGIIDVELSRNVIDSILLPIGMIRFADVSRIANPETAVTAFDISVNKINVVHKTYPLINGGDVLVSLKELLFDTADIDFTGRVMKGIGQSPMISAHATTMATVIAGGGNTFYNSKGVAWATTIGSSDFTSLLPDPSYIWGAKQISVQNHSYGTGIENYYGSDARAYDETVRVYPSLLHVFSAGNAGTETSREGRYANVPGYANLTGSFKMAKNIVTVGSVDRHYKIDERSSRGPANDGRIKPELVALGIEGSSGSAAIVSGVALLLQDIYYKSNARLPGTSLIKSILLNTADDISARGPDFNSGYGNLNAEKAMKAIGERKYFEDSLEENATKKFTIEVPSNAINLKVLLYWNDPAAPSNAVKALVNDMDLELLSARDNTSLLPWVLNSFPDSDSLNALPLRMRDSLNNIEQVTIDDPLPGEYNIVVRSPVSMKDKQPFAISYYFDLKDTVRWLYPTRDDKLIAGTKHILRFESTYQNSLAAIDYKTDAGWMPIDTNVDLAKGYYELTIPKTFSTAVFRITVSGRFFFSDTISISPVINPIIGFNCADSILVYWPKIQGAKEYQVYRMNGSFMEPYLSTTDSSIVFRSAFDNPFFAVAAIHDQQYPAIRSFAVNYQNQGTGCYFRNFLADLINDEGKLTLELGSLYGLDSIFVEKQTDTGYAIIKVEKAMKLNYEWRDNNIRQGRNTYRVKLSVLNGNSLFSKNETIYSVPSSGFLVFPNPAKRNSSVTVLTNDTELLTFSLYDNTGNLLIRKLLPGNVETIETNYPTGLYYYIFSRDQTVLKTGKLIIR